MNSLRNHISYLKLNTDLEDIQEEDVWDNGHIENQQFYSICCQQPVVTTDDECICSGCAETLNPDFDLMEKSDEERFYEEDYEGFKDRIMCDLEDFN